jgi:hypothetical protein
MSYHTSAAKEAPKVDILVKNAYVHQAVFNEDCASGWSAQADVRDGIGGYGDDDQIKSITSSRR